MGTIVTNATLAGVHIQVISGSAVLAGIAGFNVHRGNLSVDQDFSFEDVQSSLDLVAAAKTGAEEFEDEAADQFGETWTALPVLVRAEVRIAFSAMP